MKKSILFTIKLAIFISASGNAQTVSPQWSTIQNLNFTVTSAAVKYMDAVDQNVLWATGYDYLAQKRNYNWFSTTSNGGASYTSGSIFADTNTYILDNIEGIDANNAWVAAFNKGTNDKGVVYHTTNGGATWTNGGAVNMYSVAGSSFIDFVCFNTPSVGITVGDPVGGDFEIYRTSNAGGNWAAITGSAIPNALPGEYGVSGSFAKLGANNIWFGTSKNRIFRSIDAGLTWSVCPQLTSALGAAVQITDIAFRDANNGLAKAYFGSGFYSGLTLWRTTNGGATWTQIPSLDPNFGRFGLCSIPGTSLYASCEGVPNSVNMLSYSTDDGLTWNSWGGSGIPYFKVDFVSNTVGWVGSVSNSVTIGQGGIYQFSGQPLVNSKSSGTRLALELYPNPNHGIMNLLVPFKKGNTVVSVRDLFGNELYHENISYESEILNLQHLPKGIYNICFTQGDQTSNHKVIIE